MSLVRRASPAQEVRAFTLTPELQRFPHVSLHAEQVNVWRRQAELVLRRRWFGAGGSGRPSMPL